MTHLMCAMALAVAWPVYSETLVREVEVTADAPAVIFAVPNGCTFTGASASVGAVSLGEATTMNGVVLQPVAVFTNALITATFESGADYWTGTPSKVMRRQIRSRVANPEDVPLVKYTPAGVRRAAMALPTASDNSGVDMLIISPPALTNQWEAYAALRMAQMNARETSAEDALNIKVVNTFEIYDKYPYPNWATNNSVTADADCRNPAESIHKYLRENALAMGVSYVHLGGTWIDAQSLDAQGCWVYGSSVVTIKSDADGNTEPLSITNAVPGVIVTPRESLASDAFYACLDIDTKDGQVYPWSYRDPTTGEQEARYFYVQNNDLTRAPYYDAGPDVIVSRMTFKPFTINGKFYGVQEIFDAYTNKLARSEGADYKGTGFYGLFYHSQNYVTYNADGSLPYDYEFFDDTPNLFADYRENKSYFGNETSCRPMMRDHIAKYRPIRGVDVVNAKAWTSGYASLEAARDAAYAKDRDYQGALAHGWRGGCEANQWNDAFLAATGLVLLNDDSLPCDTGMLNDGANLCLGESAVEGPTGGAIASINNTHYGWSGGPDDLSLKMWHMMERGFLQYNYNVGNSWLDAHLGYLGLTTTNGTFYATNLGGTGFWVFLEHSIFGDPLARAKIPHDVPVDAASAASPTFPTFASNVLCAATCTVSGTNACLTAGSVGDLTLRPATVDAAEAASTVARFKVMKSLLSGGSTITFEKGLEGGVGGVTGFTNDTPGRVVINTTKRLYLGGFTNVSEIVVKGSNAILDVDTIDAALTNIVFEVASGVTNVIRGIKTGQLAHTTIHSTGGVIKLETADIFGGTSVALEGTIVTLGPNPKQGSLVTSSEPMNAVFSGSGRIEYPYGTRLLRSYQIADGSSITDVATGTLQVGFRYNGTLGSAPNGWFTSWSGETFSSTYGYLSPGGFVAKVASGNHPYYALPAKRGFTVGFYADLSMMADTGNRVLLDFGSANGSNNSIILLCGENKAIDLVVTNAKGASRANTFTPFTYPGDGFHLYTITFQGATVSLQIDGGEKRTSTLDALTLDAGLQIGAQYAGRINGWTIATDMLFGAMVGYDAILTDDEVADLCANYPVQTTPWSISSVLEYGTSGGTGVMRDADFAPGCYLGISKGTIEVPAGTTVDVPAISMNNTSDGGCEAYLNIRGTVYLSNAYDTDNNATDIYYLQKRSINNGETNKLVGVMMGHWAGSSTISVYTGGYLNATNTYILANYDATGDQLLDIVGGHVKTRGVINYSKDAYNGTHKTGDHGAVMIREGGILEVAEWPTKSGDLGSLPITLSNGTLRAYADWTCPRPLTFAGETNTFDCAGADIIFSGEVEGTGVLKLMDSVGGGSITFLGTHTNVTEGTGTTLCFDASLKSFGCRAGEESNFSKFFATSNKPANLRVVLNTEQITAHEYTSSYTADGVTHIIFTDESGTIYQDDTRNDYSDTTWEAMSIVKDGFTYAVAYYGTDGQWDTLANWCDMWKNTSGSHTNYTAKYTDGLPPMKTGTTSAKGRYVPTLVSGPYTVEVDQLEGWNTQLGIYGAEVKVGKWVKFQHGTDCPHAFVRVGEGGRLTIEESPNGGYSDTISFEINAPSGLVFSAAVTAKPGNATKYALGEFGSVVYAKGVSVGTHAITNCIIRLSDSTLPYKRIVRRELINFGGVGSTNVFSLTGLTILNQDGTIFGSGTFCASEYAAINKTSPIGSYCLEHNHEGLYLAYVDYSATDESKKILITGNYTGSTSSGILRNLDSSWTVTMTDATNYLDLVTSSPVLQPTIVMEDSAHGWPAFTFTDGYSKDMIGLRKVTGTGTISGSKVRPIVTQLLRLQDVTDYSGSLMLSNGATRILFDAGATITNISCQIQVASGSTAYLKGGGFWAATNGINIAGTLAPKGTATIYDNTKGIVGVGNIQPAEGYAYHCVTTTAGSTTNQVWVVNKNEPVEAARINALTSSQTLWVNGSLLVSGTISTASKLTAVATTAGTDATTYYGTFEDALTAAGETKAITLRGDVTYPLTKGVTFKIQKNSYSLTLEDNENKYLVQTSEADGVITYSADLASTKHNVTYSVDGVEVSFEPSTFIERGLPVALPVTNEVEKVFDGWYVNADYTADKTAVIPEDTKNDVTYYARMLPAVAKVNDIYYADFTSAIAAASVYGNTIYIIGNPELPAEYMNIENRLVHAAASIDGTLYSSFSAAMNAASGATIKLLADVSAPITLTSGQSFKLDQNEHSISVYVESDCRLMAENVDGVTTYTSRPCTYTGSVSGTSITWSPALPGNFISSDKLVYTGSGTAALPEGYTNCLSVTVGASATVSGATTDYTGFAGTGTIVYTDQTTIPYYNTVKTYTVGVAGTITAGDVQIAGGSDTLGYTKHAFVDGLSIVTTNRFLTGNANPSRNRIDQYAGASVISTGTGADSATQTCPMILAHWSNDTVYYTLHGGTLALRPSDGSAKRVMFGRDGSIYLTVGTGEDAALFEAPGIWAAERSNASALVIGANGTVRVGSAGLDLNAAKPVTLQGGTLANAAANTITATTVLNLASNTTSTICADYAMAMKGTVAGTGNFVKTGAGVLSFTGDLSNCTSKVTLQEGAVYVAGTSGFGGYVVATDGYTLLDDYDSETGSTLYRLVELPEARDTISVNFTSGNAKGTLPESMYAGVYPVAGRYWTQCASHDASGMSEIDTPLLELQSTGVTDDATVTAVILANNTWNAASRSTPVTGDGHMLYGYLDDGGSGASVTISNIPYTVYTAYVYFGSDQADTATSCFKPFQVNGSWCPGAGETWGDAEYTHESVTSLVSFLAGGNYCAVTDLNTGVLSIKGQGNGAGSGSRTSIAAIQIVNMGARAVARYADVNYATVQEATDAAGDEVTGITILDPTAEIPYGYETVTTDGVTTLDYLQKEDVEVISLNFTGGLTNGTLPDNLFAGVIPVKGADWIQYDGPVTNTERAVISASNTWSARNLSTPRTGNGYLLYSYLDDGGSGVSVVVSNIPYASYTTYVYFGTDKPSVSFKAFQVNDVWYPGEGETWGDADYTHETAAKSISLTENGNYYAVTNGNTTTLRIKGPSDDGYGASRCTIAAVQIVNTGARVGNRIYWDASNDGDWKGEDSNGSHTFCTEDGAVTSYVKGDTVIVTNVVQFWAKTAAQGAKYQIGTAEMPTRVYFTRSGSESNDYVLSNAVVTVAADSLLGFRRYGGTNEDGGTGWDSYNSKSPTMVTKTTISGEGTVLVDRNVRLVLSENCSITNPIQMYSGSTLVVPSDCTVTAPTPNDATGYAITVSTDDAGTITYTCRPLLSLAITAPSNACIASVTTNGTAVAGQPPYRVVEGDTVTVTFVADEDYALEQTSVTLTNVTASNRTIDASGIICYHLADSISINFTAADDNNYGVIPNDLFAGVYPVLGTNWNQCAANNSSLSAIDLNVLEIRSDDATNNTTMTAAITAKNTWKAGSLSTPQTGSGYMLYGYLDDGGSGATVTISNVPYTAYTTYVYFGSDHNTTSNCFTAFQVNDEQYPSDGAAWGNAASTHEGTNTTVTLTNVDNYYAIAGGNTATLRIKGAVSGWQSASRCTIAAVQIVSTGTRAVARYNDVNYATVQEAIGAATDIMQIYILDTSAAIPDGYTVVTSDAGVSTLDYARVALEITVPTGASVLSVTANEVQVTADAEGKYCVPVGSDVTVTFAADAGYFLSGSSYMLTSASLENRTVDTSSLVVSSNITMDDGNAYQYVFRGGVTDHETDWNQNGNWYTSTASGYCAIGGSDIPGVSGSTWHNLLLDGDYFSETIAADEDGYKKVTASSVEGYNIGYGFYHHAHVTIDTLNKNQSDSYTNRIVIDDTSKLIIGAWGDNSNYATLDLYIASADGLEMPARNNGSDTYNLYLSGSGSLKLTSAATADTYVIKTAEATLSVANDDYRTIASKKLVSLISGTTVAFTTGEDAVTLKDSTGAALTSTTALSRMPTIMDAIGSYAILQEDEGVYLYYVDYASTGSKIDYWGGTEGSWSDESTWTNAAGTAISFAADDTAVIKDGTSTLSSGTTASAQSVSVLGGTAKILGDLAVAEGITISDSGTLQWGAGQGNSNTLTTPKITVDGSSAQLKVNHGASDMSATTDLELLNGGKLYSDDGINNLNNLIAFNNLNVIGSAAGQLFYNWGGAYSFETLTGSANLKVTGSTSESCYTVIKSIQDFNGEIVKGGNNDTVYIKDITTADGVTTKISENLKAIDSEVVKTGPGTLKMCGDVSMPEATLNIQSGSVLIGRDVSSGDWQSFASANMKGIEVGVGATLDIRYVKGYLGGVTLNGDPSDGSALTWFDQLSGHADNPIAISNLTVNSDSTIAVTWKGTMNVTNLVGTGNVTVTHSTGNTFDLNITSLSDYSGTYTRSDTNGSTTLGGAMLAADKTATIAAPVTLLDDFAKSGKGTLVLSDSNITTNGTVKLNGGKIKAVADLSGMTSDVGTVVTSTETISDTDYNVYALKYTVTVPAADHATLTVMSDDVTIGTDAGDYIVEEGANLVVTYTAESGYVPASTVITLNDITANTTVSAPDITIATVALAIKVPTGTSIAGVTTNGFAVVADGAGRYNVVPGANVTVTFASEPGYSLGTTEVTLDNVSTENFTVPTESIVADAVQVFSYVPRKDGAMVVNSIGTWFSSMDNLSSPYVLGPDGATLIPTVQGDAYASLPAKSIYSLALYADVGDMATDCTRVMLALGNISNGAHGLLHNADGTVELYATTGTGTAKTSAAPKGWHLYVITYDGSTLTLYVDGAEIGSKTDVSGTGEGFQLGSIFWGRGSLGFGADLAISGIYGYDAVLRADAVAALAATYPAVEKVTISSSIELDDASATLRIHDADSGDCFIGGMNGHLVIPVNNTVETPHVRILNNWVTTDSMTLAVNGTLTVTSNETDPNVWNVRDKNQGVLLGHWHGTGTYNITGTLAATNSYITTVYTAEAQAFKVVGGTVQARGFWANNENSTIMLSEHGMLEVWDCLVADGSKTITQNYGAGTIRFMGDHKSYTLSQVMNLLDADYGTEFDLGGNTVTVDARVFGGTGRIRLEHGTMIIAAGDEGNIVVTPGATLKLTATAAQIAGGYTASGVTIEAGGSVEFWNESLTEKQTNVSGNQLYATRTFEGIDFFAEQGFLTTTAVNFATNTTLVALTNNYTISGLCAGASVNNKVPLMALVIVDPHAAQTDTCLTLQFRVKHDAYAKAVRVILEEVVDVTGVTNVTIKVGKTTYHDCSNDGADINYDFQDSDFTGTAVSTWDGGGYGVTDVVALRMDRNACVAGYAGVVYDSLEAAHAVAGMDSITLLGATELTLLAGDVYNLSCRGYVVTTSCGVESAEVFSRYEPADDFRTTYFLRTAGETGIYCYSISPRVYKRAYLLSDGTNGYVKDEPISGETIIFDSAVYADYATEVLYTESALLGYPIEIAGGMTLSLGINYTLTKAITGAGALRIAEGKTLTWGSGASVTSTLTLKGPGTLALTSGTPSSDLATLLARSDWNGTLELPAYTSQTYLNLAAWGNADSTIKVIGATASYVNSGNSPTINARVEVAGDFTVSNGSSSSSGAAYSLTFREVTGDHNLNFTWSRTLPVTINTLTDFTGTLAASAGMATTIDTVELSESPADGEALLKIDTVNTNVTANVFKVAGSKVEVERKDDGYYLKETLDPVTPGVEVNCDTAEAATNAVNLINAAKTTYIALPTNTIDAASYCSNFVARVKGTAIIVELTYDATTNLQAQVDANVKLVDPTSTAVVDITTTPGLYYTMLGGTTIESITTEGETVLATEDTTSLPKPDLGTPAAAFYRVRVKP